MRITVSALCRSRNKNKQTRSGRDKSTGSYENRHRLQDSRHGCTMRKILPSSPAELITRDHCRPMRILVQEMYISLTNALRIMESEDLRDKSYVMSRGQSCQRQARGRRTGSKRTFSCAVPSLRTFRLHESPRTSYCEISLFLFQFWAHFTSFLFVSVDLLLVSVQPKHRNSLFRYRSETTETKVLFRIVPKLVSVLVSVVSNRNYFRRTPYVQ